MRSRWWLVLFLVAAGTVGTLCLRPASTPDAVFLVVVDTLRPDRLSCYGCATHTTPHIDRLASIGVKFTRAQSVASWTKPSVGALLASLYPSQLGLTETPALPGQTFKWRKRRKQANIVLPPHAKTVGEMLQAAGFLTAAFVDQPGLNANESYHRGFEEWYYPVDRGKIRRHDQGDPFTRQEWNTQKDALTNDLALIKEFESWIATHGKEKVFVWLHLMAPHRPYLPPPKYAPPPPEYGDSRAWQSALYDGEVRAADDMIGSIVNAIERHVGLSRSVIIFTSDHGEAFAEHGMHEHGHTLHQEVINVPLIITAPSLPKGRTIDKQVRLIDIYPTILDFTGLDAPKTLEGVSVLPIIGGEGSPLPVFSEAMLYGSTERSLIKDGYKLMYDQQGERYKLYDVIADPTEGVDLASKHETRVSEMRQQIGSFHHRLEADFLRWSAAKPRNITPSQEELERLRDLEALRALGYVDDE